MSKLISFTFLLIGFQVYAASSDVNKAYVEKYKSIAIQQMLEYHIPASITLAQGILESGAGMSLLAVKGNNHFGIKCTDWTGEKMYKDDDKKGECFRVYKSAEESFVDHSLFLKNRPRYSTLFEFKTTDYKGWAHGLKKAGYATDPNYPNRLIAIIDELNLGQYDQNGKGGLKQSNETKPIAKIKSTKENKENQKEKVEEKTKVKPNLEATKKGNNRTVMLLNSRTKYIVAKKGDTYLRLSQEFNVTMWELRKYNDFGPRKDLLEEGDIVYLQPKKGRIKGVKTLQVKQGNQTLYSISQKEGVKIKTLEKSNPSLETNEELAVGTQVHLR